MNCPNEATLRTYLDGELSGQELSDELAQHLVSCPGCGEQLSRMATQKDRVSDALAMLAPRAAEMTDPAVAYARFRSDLTPELVIRPSFLSRLFAPRWRPAWGLVTAVGVISVLVGFNPGRTWAQKVLAMLRIQKVTVVSLDPSTLMSGAEKDDRPYKLIDQFISNNVVVTIDPGKPRLISSIATANQAAGFRIRTLRGLGSPQWVQLNGEAAFHMTLNRDRMQAILEEVGRSDIELPDSIDGATVAVHIPKAAVSMYGDCLVRRGFSLPSPQPGQTQAIVEQKMQALSMAKEEHCVRLIQAPSPIVSVPPNLNMSEIAEAALELAGMSPSEAHSFCQTVDWSSTLVVPVPRDNTSSQTVTVDGVDASLITETRSQLSRYALIWVKNGMIYGLSGRGTSTDALNLAASLR